MENRCKCFLLFSFLFFTAPLAIDASSQADALTKLWKAKRRVGAGLSATADFQTKTFQPEEVIVSQQPGSSKKSDKIVKLPGQPRHNVDFNQYGGHVTVDKEAGRALFYYFTEATRYQHAKREPNPVHPGPGCSSMMGAMQEQGPFRIMSNGKTLYRNCYSWNRVANVLFLESPAGVGFSYSNRTSDYNLSGDKKTAEDAYVFLVNWLERFPEYKTRDFYITGESYAGHYVPQLAHTILRHNQLPNSHRINLKGIMIGNAVIHEPTDDLGMLDFFWTHALISDKAISEVRKHCNFNEPELSDKCIAAADVADQPFDDKLNIYNIYAPPCRNPNITRKPKKPTIWSYDPCSEEYSHAYLNTPQVQEALHANAPNSSLRWERCNYYIHGLWGDRAATVLPLLREFMDKRLRVWVYSGDLDVRVPVTSTRYSLNTMKLPAKSPWRVWNVRGEVGGYTEVYEGDITFATVRAAGHEVPSYQPSRAFALFSHFINGTPLPP